MAYVQIIEDDAGKELTRLYTTHDAYLLPDGSEMFVHSTPAWCPKCQNFSLVEALESPDRMEEVVRSIFERNKKHLDFQQQVLDQLLHNASQWRLALQHRTSSPKCLACGSTSFIKLPEDHAWMPHPANPQTKVRMKECHIHARMSDYGDLFDTEGARIPDRHATI